MAYGFQYRIVEGDKVKDLNINTPAYKYLIEIWFPLDIINIWGEDLNYDKIIYRLSKDYIRKRLKNNSLEIVELYQVPYSLLTDKCPFDINKIEMAVERWIELEN